jgi:competence protein ComFC
LDVHTISSVKVGVNEAGHDVFDTKRSELGELLYRLKYNGDTTAAQEIIDAASTFLRPHSGKFDLIVPVPPSGQRPVQPVVLLAGGIGAKLGIDVGQCISATRPTAQLKGVSDPAERKKLLDGLYAVDAKQKSVREALLSGRLDYRTRIMVPAEAGAK